MCGKVYTLLMLLCLVRNSRENSNLLQQSSSGSEEIPEELFHLPLQQSSATQNLRLPQTRSLLQPREIDGMQKARPAKPSKPLRYSGEKFCDGACITSRACDYHQGTPRGYCSNGNICCLCIQKSCGAVSRDKISFFRSPQFPKSLNESLECSYRIYPVDGTCGLKIDFETFELRRPKRYTKVEKCVDDIMFIMNSAGGPTEGICEMENHTAIVEVDPASRLPVIFLFVTQSASVSWSLKISQINCKTMPLWKNSPECGRQLMYEPNEYDSDGPGLVTENVFRPHLHHQPYIVHGKDAEAREFPWQVSIQLTNHRCGGSIIDDRHILTAAHCLYRNAFVAKHRLKVIVGDYILDTEKDGEHEEFEIDKIIVHYNYKPTESHFNDIAVIRLNGVIKFNDKTQPICLATGGIDVYEKVGIVSGWGRLNATDSTQEATRLQKVNVKIISNEECRRMVKREYEEVTQKNLTYSEVARSSSMGISEKQLCGVSRLNTSVCFGDSGGPLMIQSEDDGRYFQIGLVSYGLGKCRTDRQTPGSYTNVQKYMNFITFATMDP